MGVNQSQDGNGTGSERDSNDFVKPSKHSSKSAKDKLPDRKSSHKSRGKDVSEANSSTAIIRDIIPNEEIGHCLKKIPLLAHLNKFERDKLGGALREESFQQNQPVFKQGDPGDTFYIIKEGKAAVTLVDEKSNSPVVISELTPGDFFGEQSILLGTPRSASVTAVTALVCYVMGKAKFMALFREDRLDITFPRRRKAYSAEHSQSAPQRRDSLIDPELNVAEMPSQVRQMLLRAIDGCFLFQQLEREHRERVASVMYAQDYKAREFIIREGDEGHALYVIESGDVDVYQLDGETNKQVLVDHKGPGQVIGELALMYNAPRNATCVAVVPTRLRVLERRIFNKIVRDIGERKMDQYAKWLANITHLASLTNNERERLAEALEILDCDEQRPIYSQGEAADSLYIIVAGEVVATRKNEKTGVIEECGRYHNGDYFGEGALTTKEPRNCTVTAVGTTRCLRLKQCDFMLLMGAAEYMIQKKAREAPAVPEWKPKNIPFNELKVIGILGNGTYGSVKLVRHEKTAQSFALKSVSKHRIVQTHQKAHIIDEKKIMSQLDHPFITKLHATYKDRDCLHFLLEPLLGGELLAVLQKYNRMFSPPQARFYAAQVVLVFEHMHASHFIYRDLKPENLLLDAQGYLKIIDFGFVKKVKNKTWTMCGTPEYLAPEVIASRGHGKGVDWWTLGIFIFEMLASFTPFFGHGDDLKMYDRICHGKLRFPSHFDQDVKSLIKGLLHVHPTRRLGVIQGGADLVKSHKWFKEFDWQSLLWKKLQAPVRPRVESDVDLHNFDPNLKETPVQPYVDDGTNWDEEF